MKRAGAKREHTGGRSDILIYLDNAATSFLKPQSVYNAVAAALKSSASPGRGGYKAAVKASETLYAAREALSELFNIASPENIIFTDNATTAINTGLKGIAGHGIAISKMEHNAVARPAKKLSDSGERVVMIDADSDGFITPEAVERVLSSSKVGAVCLIHASNVCGSLNDIKSIGEIVKRHNAVFMVDASQSAGCTDIDVEACKIDLLAFPGHKGLLGPQGTGGLYIREGLTLGTLTEGGTGSMSESLLQPDIMPDRFESGTQNVPGIAGLYEGVRFVKKVGAAAIGEKERYLSKILAEDLSSIEGVRVCGKPGSGASVGVVSVTTRLGSVELADMLAKDYSIAVRAGLHCAPLAHRSLGTLESGTVRFSPGFFTTKENVKYAARAVARCLK